MPTPALCFSSKSPGPTVIHRPPVSFQDYNDEIRQEQLRELSYLNGSEDSGRGRSIRGRGIRITSTAPARYISSYLDKLTAEVDRIFWLLLGVMTTGRTKQQDQQQSEKQQLGMVICQELCVCSLVRFFAQVEVQGGA
jgi:hypothetical protein